MSTNLILNKSLIYILTNTTKPPAALPWAALPAISLGMLVAEAHIAEPVKKSTIATSRTMSGNLAHTGAAAPLLWGVG